MNVNCPDCLNFKDSKCNAREISIVNGKCISEKRDSIKWYMHKYYRGFLLPALTDALGEVNTQYVHDFILKPEWIERATGARYLIYYDYNEIPKKYTKDGGANIYRFNDGKSFAVLPSMSTFTIQEAKDFILFCERLLYVEIGMDTIQPDEEHLSYRKGAKL